VTSAAAARASLRGPGADVDRTEEEARARGATLKWRVPKCRKLVHCLGVALMWRVP